MGGEANFLEIGAENSLWDVFTLRMGGGTKLSSEGRGGGARACAAGCVGSGGDRRFALASDTDLPIAAFCLPISLGGSGASSPPSPMISGAVLANPTVSPFLLGGLVKVGPSGPGLSSPNALT